MRVPLYSYWSLFISIQIMTRLMSLLHTWYLNLQSDLRFFPNFSGVETVLSPSHCVDAVCVPLWSWSGALPFDFRATAKGNKVDHWLGLYASKVGVGYKIVSGFCIYNLLLIEQFAHLQEGDLGDFFINLRGSVYFVVIIFLIWICSLLLTADQALKVLLSLFNYTTTTLLRLWRKGALMRILTWPPRWWTGLDAGVFWYKTAVN